MRQTRILTLGAVLIAAVALVSPTARPEQTVTISNVEVKQLPEIKENQVGTFSYYEPLVTLFQPQVQVQVQQEADTEPAPARPVAPAPTQMTLRYRILLLDRNNNVLEVTDKHRFHTGDRIRLLFESNVDGYLYIFQKGASGRSARLFPDARINSGENHILRYRRISVPPPVGEDRGWWRFDAASGDEEIYLFLSPQPITALSDIATSENGFVDEAGWQVVTQQTRSADDKGTNVYYEDAGMDGWDYGKEADQAFVVTSMPLLMHHFTLRHAK